MSDQNFQNLDAPLLNNGNQEPPIIRRRSTFNRRDLEQQATQQQFQKLKEDIRKQLLALIVYVFFFSFCVYNFPEQPNCNIQPREFTKTFLFYVVLPSLALVLTASLFYDKDFQKYKAITALAALVTFFGRGILTWIGIVRIFAFDGDCYSPMKVHIINFYLIVLGGLLNWFLLTLIGTVLVCCCPCFTLVLCFGRSAHRDQQQQQAEQKAQATQVLSKLIQYSFNKNLYTQTSECAICLAEFDENSQVTPLPCDSRHYFHSDCLSDWFNSGKITCPLCRKPITTEEIESLNKVGQSVN